MCTYAVVFGLQLLPGSGIVVGPVDGCGLLGSATPSKATPRMVATIMLEFWGQSGEEWCGGVWGCGGEDGCWLGVVGV